jgi:rhodanese-related sulfurtransferase
MLSSMFSSSVPTADPRTIGDGEFVEAVNNGNCIVVDVRETHEFAAGHIPCTLNLPLSTFDPLELPTGKPVVLVCQSGRRSLNALNQAQAAGREDIRHYPGGFNGWRAPHGRTRRDS